MMSLLFLIPIALLLTGLIIWLFLWAVKNGQYDDLDRAGKEALYDDENVRQPAMKPVIKAEQKENEVYDR